MTNSSPTVSVLMPVYNGENFVAEAIQSIIDQTYTDWEMIVCDDGSSDGTYDICCSYARKDARIQVIRNERNLHLSRTSNRLISLARGKYLTWQDADDISVAERLEWQVEVLLKQPDVGVVCGIGAWLDDNGEVFHQHPAMLVKGRQFPTDRDEMVRSLLIKGSKVMNCGVMFRRTALEGIPGPLDPDALSSQDWQLLCDIAHKFRFFGLPKVIEYVRRGDNHHSQVKMHEMIFREATRCVRCVYEKYADDPNSPVNYWVYRAAISTRLLVEGRFVSGSKGARLVALAVWYNPLNRKAWLSVGDFSLRAVRKLVNRSPVGAVSTRAERQVES